MSEFGDIQLNSRKIFIMLWNWREIDEKIIASAGRVYNGIHVRFSFRSLDESIVKTNKRFPFRYYIHDPWWINSPWYDRYDGSPCDIYLPMAISRINAEGKVETANSLNILSIDNSYGEMPDNCVNEPLPHILKAEKDSADEPAPLVWVYPMREYTTSHDADVLCEMNEGDRYVCAAINEGLPLCSVTSTDSFLHHTLDVYKKSTIISPVPENPAVLEKLTHFASYITSIILLS